MDKALVVFWRVIAKTSSKGVHCGVIYAVEQVVISEVIETSSSSQLWDGGEGVVCFLGGLWCLGDKRVA